MFDDQQIVRGFLEDLQKRRRVGGAVFFGCGVASRSADRIVREQGDQLIGVIRCRPSQQRGTHAGVERMRQGEGIEHDVSLSSPAGCARDTGGMEIGELLGLEQLTWGMLIFVVLAAFGAGWMDAVVGGGGLLQRPVRLLIPGIAPVQALATNKLGSVFGTATSSVTYYRRVRPDIRTALPMAGIALIGSFGGAAVATVLPPAAFKPIIIV